MNPLLYLLASFGCATSNVWKELNGTIAEWTTSSASLDASKLFTILTPGSNYHLITTVHCSPNLGNAVESNRNSCSLSSWRGEA